MEYERAELEFKEMRTISYLKMVSPFATIANGGIRFGVSNGGDE